MAILHPEQLDLDQTLCRLHELTRKAYDLVTTAGALLKVHPGIREDSVTTVSTANVTECEVTSLLKNLRRVLAGALWCIESVSSMQVASSRSQVAFSGKTNPPPVASRSVSRSFRLYGPLNKLSMLEVIEFARTTSKTGRLSVEALDLNGFVDILEGQAVYAEVGEFRGFEAFCELLRTPDGVVEFHNIAVSSESRNLENSTLELVFRALQTLDEHMC